MADKKVLVNLDLNKNQLLNATIQNLATDPETGIKGQVYFNTVSNTLKVYNGTTWVDAGIQGVAWGDITGSINNQTDLKNALDAKVDTNVAITGATKCKITYDTKGLVTSGADLEASDIPALATNKVTTVADYTKASAAGAIGTADSLNSALGKLEYKADAAVVANAAITPSTKCKITYDAKGLVTAGADLTSTDIPDLSATYLTTTLKGAVNGLAELDAEGKVPSTQLPSYVDDVIDSYVVSGATALTAGWLSATDGGTAFTPETGKIYVVLSAGEYLNKTYRWSGSTYVEISASPAQATEAAAGIAEIATQAETYAGSDDYKIVTPLKLMTFIGNCNLAANNPALTQSGGVCTWEITNTLNNADVICSVREVGSGEEVYASVKYSASKITIKINSASNIAAGTYRAVIIGKYIAA